MDENKSRTANTFVDPITLEVLTEGEDEKIFLYTVKSSKKGPVNDKISILDETGKQVYQPNYGNNSSFHGSQDKYCIKYGLDSLVNYLLATGCFQEPTTKNQFTQDDI